MKLNEDYFKDIDEEEIEAATSDSFYEDETDSAIKLLNIYDCNYSDTIVLYYPDSPYHFTDLDDVIYRINKIADRIYKLFDLYNIEHSEFVLYD